MKHALLIVLVFGALFAQTFDAPQVICTDADPFGCTLEFSCPEISRETFTDGQTTITRLFYPTGGYCGEVGEPMLPTFAKLVAMPANTSIRAEMIYMECETIRNVTLTPVTNPLAEHDDTETLNYIRAPQAFPHVLSTPNSQNVRTGDPAIFRDFRVAPVDFFPVSYDAANKIATVATKIKVRVHFSGFDARNAKTPPESISQVFDEIYEPVIANYWFFKNNRTIRNGNILYVCRDSFTDDIAPLVLWKKRCGFNVQVAAAYEDIGGGDAPSSDEIYNYIHAAYYSDFPPDYVVLVGDVRAGGIFLPDFAYVSTHTGETYASDFGYSKLEGDDYLPDVVVGRISVFSEAEAAAYAAKVVKYETDPLAGGADWLRRGLVVAGNCCGTPQPTSPRLVALWTRELALRKGFTNVDTFFWTNSSYPYFPSDISAAINSGVAFINYRGWAGTEGWSYPSYRVTHVQGLSNVNMPPIVTSIVCGSGDFKASTDPCFGEAWIRVGTPAQPKAGIAFYGSSDHDTHTKWNNPNAEGFYWALLTEKLLSFGQCVLRAKLTIFLSYPENRPESLGVEHYMSVYNILADPSVAVWRAVPTDITVSAPASVRKGESVLTVRISGIDGGTPVTDAMLAVYFYNDGKTYTTFASSDGSASVTFPPSVSRSADSVSIVVTAPGEIPYARTLPVLAASSGISFSSVSIDDHAHGNGDGILSPGERADIMLSITNDGSTPLASATATLLPHESFDIIDGTANFGSIAVGATAAALVPFAITINSHDVDSTRVPLLFYFAALAETIGTETFIAGPKLSFHRFAEATDSVLDPAEVGMTTFFIENFGSVALGAATLTFEDGRWITFAEHEATLPLGIAAHAVAALPAMSVEVSDAIIRGAIDTLRVTLDDGFARETVAMPVRIGRMAGDVFGGPDRYGYYCYSVSDVESGRAPRPNWHELSPYHGGSGTLISMRDDQTVVVPLPFTFKYYGIDFDSVYICSNGWLSFGPVDTGITFNFWNRPIPDPSGPAGMVCPFWDDLDPAYLDGYGVFYKHIPEQHIFVVEWHSINSHDRDRAYEEWFECVLRDPVGNVTPTGDGEILFYYRRINDVDTMTNADEIAEFSTVGIESPDQTDGLQYVFDKHYASHAERVWGDAPILFTTKPPMAISSVKVDEAVELPVRASVELAPNPFNSTVAITVRVPTESRLTLAAYDFVGHRVRTIEAGVVGAGARVLTWDSRDDFGNTLSSGVYFLRATIGTEVFVKRAFLVK